MFNPSTQTGYCRDRERALFGTAPQLGALQRSYGTAVAETWLSIQLNDLSEFTGCRAKLNERQLDELAAMMTDMYPHYRLTEFMLFFQCFKRGEYGRFYGAIDPMVIMEALNTFDAYRRRMHIRRQCALSAEKRSVETAALEAMRERYRSRVPGAYTPDAAMSFLQYQLLGYDSADDATLGRDLDAIASGDLSLPADVVAMLSSNI